MDHPVVFTIILEFTIAAFYEISQKFPIIKWTLLLTQVNSLCQFQKFPM